MLVVYGPYHSHGDHVLTEGASVAYEALNRIGWSAAVCWIIFACVTGNGGSFIYHFYAPVSSGYSGFFQELYLRTLKSAPSRIRNYVV